MKGRIYRAFLSSLRALGYSVSTRVLVAADYGDPTTRRRLFIMARKGKTIRWPEPTHSKHGDDLFGKHPKWRAAREIIDWSVPGTSIYGRSKPLVPNTLRRIAHGLEKFGGAGLRPFIAQLDMGGSVHDIDSPLPTITSADTWTLVDPFMIPVNHGEGDVRTYSVEAPMPTITGFDALGVVQPFVIQLNGTSAEAISASSRPVSSPLPTVASREPLRLVEPFVVEYYGTGGAESVDDPLNTVTSHDRFGLVQPFLTEYHGGERGSERVSSVEAPLPAQDTSNRFGLVEPVIVRSSDGRYYQLDIRYRMLMPSELAAAMSFPADYVFTGNRETIVKQIGNAVPVSLASHLCQALLS
jgi:DNA (cytosine-5)-methyltransferase 1